MEVWDSLSSFFPLYCFTLVGKTLAAYCACFTTSSPSAVCVRARAPHPDWGWLRPALNAAEFLHAVVEAVVTLQDGELWWNGFLDEKSGRGRGGVALSKGA